MRLARQVTSAVGQEGREFSKVLLLTEHHVSAGFEADKPRAGDALGRTLTRLAGGELVVFGVDDQGRYANRLQGSTS